MQTFFHVSLEALPPGQVLEPGRFGAMLRRTGQVGGHSVNAGNNAVIMIWETALETARLTCTPDAPSRLDCVFGTRTLEDAIAFRDRFRRGGRIYEVTCSGSTPVHDGNYDAITDPPRDATPWLNFMPAFAINYWCGRPDGIVEVLIGGSVTVLHEVAALAPA